MQLDSASLSRVSLSPSDRAGIIVAWRDNSGRRPNHSTASTNVDAALRDFDPAYDRSGSCVTSAVMSIGGAQCPSTPAAPWWAFTRLKASQTSRFGILNGFASSTRAGGNGENALEVLVVSAGDDYDFSFFCCSSRADGARSTAVPSLVWCEPTIVRTCSVFVATPDIRSPGQRRPCHAWHSVRHRIAQRRVARRFRSWWE